MAPIRCCFDQTAVWHSDAARGPSTPSFNHLVGSHEQRLRHDERTERARCALATSPMAGRGHFPPPLLGECAHPASPGRPKEKPPPTGAGRGGENREGTLGDCPALRAVFLQVPY